MNGIHPKLGLAAAAAVALAAAVGCSNQPGALKNPFSAVDRVPPPSTRVLAPGTAQPYYQGDPLPAMQSSNGFTAPTAPPSPVWPRAGSVYRAGRRAEEAGLLERTNRGDPERWEFAAI